MTRWSFCKDDNTEVSCFGVHNSQSLMSKPRQSATVQCRKSGIPTEEIPPATKEEMRTDHQNNRALSRFHDSRWTFHNLWAMQTVVNMCLCFVPYCKRQCDISSSTAQTPERQVPKVRPRMCGAHRNGLLLKQNTFRWRSHN